MMQSRMIGDIKVTRILEYAGPTHDPAFLFPSMEPGVLDEHRQLMAPNHWVPHMNKLIVTIQFWIVQVGSHIIVIDTGVGNFKPRADVARMNMLNNRVTEWMTAAGAPPEKVTHVVITHLHSDHVGWNTSWKDNRWVPTFPNAKYYLPKDDFDFCFQGKNKASDVIDVFGDSFFDSVMPIVDAGLAEMMQPGQEIADCLLVEAAPGHSPGQVVFRVRSGGEEGLFSGDILHSPVQIVRPEINSGYCIWEDTARQTRLAFLNRAADREALIMPVHFGEPHCGYIRRQGDGFRFEPASW
ncbi:MBL fold metallo-hydrolase [Pseudomonas sp. RIT-PI-AD]|uniref:MBL fold metallo-hydrolase n=1 Tax=Pseudomonas sp. RIT-PI-AD TaxID=3035294 RepID=UPI0021D98DA4|nr:MBL fold metallo-hydrolase [Pseudomonas sp. RIT-PI-AD]